MIKGLSVEKSMGEVKAQSSVSPRQWGLTATLGAALMVFVVGLGTAPNRAVDLFWQIRTGQIIVQLHGVPNTFTYSWSRFGQPWIAHEWGACLLLWAAHQIGGFRGVWLLEIALLAATFITLWSLFLRETRAPITALCLAVWAAKMASPLLSPRPHLFTWLFLIILTGIVLAVRRDPSKLGRLWLLVPLCAVWANFHGGVIVGISLLATFGACDMLQAKYAASRVGQEEVEVGQYSNIGRRELVVAVACAAALLVNPYGWRIYQIFGSTLGDSTMRGFVSEWSALDFHSVLGMAFEGLVGLILFGFALTRRRRDLADIIIVAILAHEAVTASRNVPLFAFVGLLVAARHIQSALEHAIEQFGGSRATREASLFGPSPPVLIAAIVAVAVMLQGAGSAYSALRGTPGPPTLARIASVAFDLDDFPAGACRFLRAEGFPTDGHLYNAYNLGGYILWAAPQYRVFINTQTDVYSGSVLRDYAHLDALPFDWQQILGRYNPDFVLTSTDEAQARLFASSPDWTLCYADSADLDSATHFNALIFVRNEPRFADLIARCRRDCLVLRTNPTLLNGWRKEHYGSDD